MLANFCMKRWKMPKNVTNVAKSLTVFIFTAPLGGKCNAVLHVMHYIFGSKCTAILSNAVQFSKCTATCNALHSTSLVQYSDDVTYQNVTNFLYNNNPLKKMLNR